jgi:DNA-binding transcriptional LysR family regulator
MHQVRYFMALCSERNFTRAAKRTGVTQPSLTNAIGALEQELGGTLFYRKPLVALTPFGHAMAPFLEQIADHADRAYETARAWRERRPGELDRSIQTPPSPLARRAMPAS